MAEKSPTIFISYSRENKDLKGRVVKSLKAATFACLEGPWVDTDEIRPGDHWREIIDNALIGAERTLSRTRVSI